MRKIFLSLIISIFIISLTYGEYVMKWTNRYNAGITWNEGFTEVGVAVDSYGNVYVAGTTWNGANNDYCTIKYDSSGSVLWTKFYNGGDD